MIQKTQKRQTKQKLQKRLQLRQLSLFQALQQDISVDWFKQSNPAFLALLSLQGMKQLINYIIIPGPVEDKMRSYKIPMIATQILSTPCPKVFQLMFTQDKTARGGVSVGWLIQYFWKGQPNYIISGYVIRILTNLIPGNPHKVLQFMIKNSSLQMLLFLQSHSIAQFLLRLIIVQDLLLNAFIKQRLQLFNKLVQIYVQNKMDKQILQNVNYMLCESFNRLWSMKNKQLGRFSGSLLRMIEVVIDYDDKYQQEKFIPIIIKLLSEHASISPVIIMVIYKKIYKKISNLKCNKIKSQSNQLIQSFSSINLSLLQSIQSIVNYFPQQFIKMVQKQNIFVVLLSFVKRFQWNNIVLVQIQKIIKNALAKKQFIIYKVLIDILLENIKQWKQGLKNNNKFGRGYKGFLDNVQNMLNQMYVKNQSFIDYLNKSTLMNKFQRILPRTQSNSSNIQKQASGFRVVNNIAIPCYLDNTQICALYSQFFQQTQIINKKYLMQNPGDHIKHKQDNQLITEIQNQNQLVYKLLTQHFVLINGDENDKKNIDQQNNNNIINNAITSSQ